MKYVQGAFLSFCLSLLLSSCFLFSGKKDPEPELPPATQEGRNTFGCYVNGKAWVPEGRKNFYRSNLSLDIDTYSRGGYAGILAYKYIPGSVNQQIAITVDSLPKYGEATYPFLCKLEGSNIDGGIAAFTDNISKCEYYCMDEARIVSGFCRITRYDLNRRIIAGTFEFTLAKPGCDTIRITEGRFDIKIN
jgi:hypothetical protein